MNSKLLLLALALGVTTSAEAGLKQQIDALVRKEVSTSQFQGNVLVTRGDATIFSKSYGKADLEFGVPNARAMKFRIGSITKQFTATAVLALHAAGKIGSLHDPVGQYVSVPEGWRNVTIHELLTHTAALEHDPALLKTAYGMYHSLGQLFDSITAQAFLPGQVPGGKYSYSNSGYNALAYLVQKVSGMDYADYLRKAVLAPAGLADTDDDNDSLLVPNRARGYWVVQGQLYNATGLDLSNVDGAGSMYSTVDDLAKWDRALRDTRVLPAAERDLLFQPYAEIPGGSEHYGYGWVIDQWQGHKLIWHNGEINGYSSDFARYVDDRVVIVTLSNRYDLSASLTRIREGIAALVLR